MGNGKNEDQTSPVRILSNVTTFAYAALDDSYEWGYCAAITKNGDLYCWGSNDHGQIGNGSKEDQYIPEKVLSDVISVYLKGGCSAAITANGDLYCWGRNDCGQVGNGNKDDQCTPVKVLSDVKDISLFKWNSMAIVRNGDLYCWGSNSYGQVGNGSTENQYTPVKVLSDVRTIAECEYAWDHIEHCAVITKNGDLYCWGRNDWGQVGNGGTDAEEDYFRRQFTTPVKVLSNAESAYLGEYFSAAITKNADLYCWGRNEDGEVGNGSEEEKQYVPVKVLSNVLTIDSSSNHNVAVTKDGDLYCWGRNEEGEIGDGSDRWDGDVHTPVKVLDNVKTAVAGTFCSAAITKDNNFYYWGNQSQVMSGDDYVGQLTPIKMLNNVKSICFPGGAL